MMMRFSGKFRRQSCWFRSSMKPLETKTLQRNSLKSTSKIWVCLLARINCSSQSCRTSGKWFQGSTLSRCMRAQGKCSITPKRTRKATWWTTTEQALMEDRLPQMHLLELHASRPTISLSTENFERLPDDIILILLFWMSSAITIC